MCIYITTFVIVSVIATTIVFVSVIVIVLQRNVEHIRYLLVFIVIVAEEGRYDCGTGSAGAGTAAVGDVQGQQTWEHAPRWVGGGCCGRCTGTANLETCPQVGGEWVM